MRMALIVIATGLLIVVAYYGVIFDGQLPDHPSLRGKNDLVLHVGAFAVLAVPVCLLWRGFVPLMALTFGAAMIEGVQSFQAGRTAALDDLAAGLIGIAIGAICAVMIRRVAGTTKFLKTREH